MAVDGGRFLPRRDFPPLGSSASLKGWGTQPGSITWNLECDDVPDILGQSRVHGLPHPSPSESETQPSRRS